MKRVRSLLVAGSVCSSATFSVGVIADGQTQKPQEDEHYALFEALVRTGAKVTQPRLLGEGTKLFYVVGHWATKPRCADFIKRRATVTAEGQLKVLYPAVKIVEVCKPRP